MMPKEIDGSVDEGRRHLDVICLPNDANGRSILLQNIVQFG